jgi:hypothetical protein
MLELEDMCVVDRRAAAALFEWHWNWDRGGRVRDETNVVVQGVESPMRLLRRRFLAAPESKLADQIVLKTLQTAKYSSTVSLHRYPSSHQDHIYETDPSSAVVVVLTVDRDKWPKLRRVHNGRNSEQ